MPTYTFNCQKCGPFEIFQTLKEYAGKCKCPQCKKLSKDRVYEVDLNTTIAVRLVDSELQTLGHVASRNRDKFSNDYKEHLRRKHNEYRNTQAPELPQGMSYMRKTEDG